MVSRLTFKDTESGDQIEEPLNFVRAQGPFLECITHEGRELVLDTLSGQVSLVATGANRRSQKHPNEPKCRKLAEGEPVIGSNGRLDTS